jgi:hypothetical protein
MSAPENNFYRKREGGAFSFVEAAHLGLLKNSAAQMRRVALDRRPPSRHQRIPRRTNTNPKPFG